MYVNIPVHFIGDHADDVSVLSSNVYTRKEKSGALLVASKEIGLEVNADKTEHTIMS